MKKFSSLERVLTALSHKEPDRVPLFLLFSMYGAKEMGVSIKEYYSNPMNVINTQLKLKEKFDNDCLYSFYYAGIELESLGGAIKWSKDEPPLSNSLLIRNNEDINNLKFINPKESKLLTKVLDTTKGLKKEAKDEVPIIGVVMSPFSLPVMQMGFEKYLNVLFKDKEAFEKLMRKNIDFCIKWGNAQLEAGATAICYFDPVSSTTIIPREMYLKTGYLVAKETLSNINGPTATHFASGRTISNIDLLHQTGTAAVGASSLDDLNELKLKTEGKITIIGNLNGIEMCSWTVEEAKEKVKEIIRKAGKNGGLIISDNHGEIPYQVSEKILFAISDAVKEFGKY